MTCLAACCLEFCPINNLKLKCSLSYPSFLTHHQREAYCFVFIAARVPAFISCRRELFINDALRTATLMIRIVRANLVGWSQWMESDAVVWNQQTMHGWLAAERVVELLHC